MQLLLFLSFFLGLADVSYGVQSAVITAADLWLAELATQGLGLGEETQSECVDFSISLLQRSARVRSSSNTSGYGFTPDISSEVASLVVTGANSSNARHRKASLIKVGPPCNGEACSGGVMEAMATGMRVKSMQAYRRRFGDFAMSVWDPRHNAEHRHDKRQVHPEHHPANRRHEANRTYEEDEDVWLKRYEHHGKKTAGGSCDEILWPDLDHNLICGNCKVLVNHFNSKYFTCDRYCRHIGRTCVAAFEEANEDCAEAFPITCDQTIESTDAICQCSENPPAVAAVGTVAWLRSFVVCLTASSLVEANDIVWFLPFAASECGWRFVPLYLCLKEVFALMAWGVASMVEWLEQRHQSMHFTRLLSLVTAALLGMYSALLFAEWAQTRQKENPNAALLSTGGDAACGPSCPSSPDALVGKHASSKHSKRPDLSVRQLLTICTIGNLDGLGVFIPPLSTGTFTGPQLALSLLLVGLFVVVTCFSAVQLRSVVRAVDAVPLWAIIACFAFWSLAAAAQY